MKKILALTLVSFVLLMTFSIPHVNAQKGKIRVLWFDGYYRDPGFRGAVTGVPPNETIFSEYPNIELKEVSSSSDIPSDWYAYDVLVLADTGFPKNLSNFKGGLIITLDSSVSTLFYWLTGNNKFEDIWDYYSYTIVKWIAPYSEFEQVKPTTYSNLYDAALYKTQVNDIPWLTPSYDLIYAVANDSPNMIAAGLYKVTLRDLNFYWLFLGPYDARNPQSPNRQSYLVADLITKHSSTIWAPKETSIKERRSFTQFSALTFMYYRHYLILNETLTKTIESTNDTVLRETLTEKLELAHEEYQAALRYGPILRNLSNIQVFIHLRKAVIYLREALSLLS